MKKILCLSLSFIILLSVCGCAYDFQENKHRLLNNRPIAQPNTMWVSTDGRIKFVVEEKYTSQDEWYMCCTGEMLFDDGVDYVEVVFGSGPDIRIVPKENRDENQILSSDYLEYWIGDFEYPDRFTATVKRSTYFNEGDEIEFYRIDK